MSYDFEVTTDNLIDSVFHTCPYCGVKTTKLNPHVGTVHGKKLLNHLQKLTRDFTNSLDLGKSSYDEPFKGIKVYRDEFNKKLEMSLGLSENE